MLCAWGWWKIVNRIRIIFSFLGRSLGFLVGIVNSKKKKSSQQIPKIVADIEESEKTKNFGKSELTLKHPMLDRSTYLFLLE